MTRLPLLPACAVILDLEYATRWPQKHEARCLAAEAIPYLREMRPDLNITVRINVPAAGHLAERDLEIIVPAQPDAIRIPAVEDASALERLDARAREIEGRHGLIEGSIRFHPMIESPHGLSNIRHIASASARNEALCLGGEDWAHNVGLTRTRGGRELEYIKASLVTVAAEYGLVPIDSVYNWLDDDEGLAADCHQSKQLGFRGRATIHPRQIRTIQDIYRPEPDTVKKARSLLDRVVETSVDGTTLLLADGVIIDPQAVFQARLTCLSAETPR